MPNPTEPEKIKACALRLLARREHAKNELIRKLLQRNFKLENILPVLETLTEKNWQSDERFVENYIRSCINKGYGPLKIEAALRERGISSAMITQYLPHDRDFWSEQIKKVWEKKFSRVDKTDHSSVIQQQRFLLSRGFTGEQIKKAVIPSEAEGPPDSGT